MSANPASTLTPWFPPAAPGTPPPRPLRAIGIVGSSKTATAIAHVCASKSLGVIMHDSVAGALTQGVEVIRGLFRAMEERHEITHAAAHKAMGGIGISTSVDDMEFCDVIIDTLTEDAASKRARFADFARIMPPDAVLASCASEEGLEELFAGTTSPGRVIGLSFFDPVESSRQIQITIGSQTSRETAERVLAFVNTLGKAPVVKGKARSRH